MRSKIVANFTQIINTYDFYNHGSSLRRSLRVFLSSDTVDFPPFPGTKIKGNRLSKTAVVGVSPLKRVEQDSDCGMVSTKLLSISRALTERGMDESFGVWIWRRDLTEE